MKCALTKFLLTCYAVLDLILIMLYFLSESRLIFQRKIYLLWTWQEKMHVYWFLSHNWRTIHKQDGGLALKTFKIQMNIPYNSHTKSKSKFESFNFGANFFKTYLTVILQVSVRGKIVCLFVSCCSLLYIWLTLFLKLRTGWKIKWTET